MMQTGLVISPFWCGVLVTVLAEVVLFVGLAIAVAHGKKKRKPTIEQLTSH